MTKKEVMQNIWFELFQVGGKPGLTEIVVNLTSEANKQATLLPLPPA